LAATTATVRISTGIIFGLYRRGIRYNLAQPHFDQASLAMYNNQL
jgi:hypothetical protein